MKLIQVGDVFSWHPAGQPKSDVRVFRREPDDPAPMFECERMRVTTLASPLMVPFVSSTFGVEPEWFRQRGFEAAQ